MGKEEGLVFEAFGEASQTWHLATSRVKVAGSSQRGKRGKLREEKAEVGLATAFLHWTLSVASVKAQD